jgi:hypothetical protein
MNTYQLKCAINHDCNMGNAICDVYPADEIPRTLRMCKRFIVNTYPHQKHGKHWIAFLYDDDTLECFDSYGSSPDGYSVYLRQFMGTFYRIKVNKKRLQSNDTAGCGQYCLFYLMCRTRGYSMDQITDMFNENYHLNDQLVYNFIDERFHCCMSYSSCSFQVCTCDSKI